MRTVWLASYPKSGNTWFRMLVANLSARDGRPMDINDLSERGGIASARAPFDFLTLIDSGLLTHDEVDRLRPRIYEALAGGEADDDPDDAAEAGDIRFVKTHDAYTRTSAGEPLLGGARGAAGAILIVRDPRDVAPSLANHMSSTIDEAIAFMGNARAAFCARTDRQQIQLRQHLPGWSGHLESWLGQRDIPVHLVRYEDIHARAQEVLQEALAFAGKPASAAQIAGAVELADFSQLRRQEEERGFREAPRARPGGNFFRRGEAGAWRDELTAEQIARIEAAHGPMMLRLGYEPACEPARGQVAMGVVA